MQVLDGMFGLARRLFEVEVVPADGEAPVWHSDVRFFKVLKVGRGLARDGLEMALGRLMRGRSLPHILGRATPCLRRISP